MLPPNPGGGQDRRPRAPGRCILCRSAAWRMATLAPLLCEGTTEIHEMIQAEHAPGYRKANV